MVHVVLSPGRKRGRHPCRVAFAAPTCIHSNRPELAKQQQYTASWSAPAPTYHHVMGELSRVSSQRPLLVAQDDTESLTSFPDPAPGSPTTANTPPMTEHLYGLLDRSEPTMFDERPAVNADDPRALSAADSSVLQGVVDHHGAINLVKRLSETLAERDAHITALQRLCEEYKVPKDRVTDTACRVKQAERRRLSLSAASEDLAPSRGTQSEISVCSIRVVHLVCFVLTTMLQTLDVAPKSTTVGGTVRGITRLFGGMPRKRDPGQRSM